MAKQVTNIAWAIAHTMNATGAAGPSFSAIVPGKTKMLAPMVVLTIFAVRPGTPMARSSCASGFDGRSGAMQKQCSVHYSETSLSRPRSGLDFVRDDGLASDSMRDSHLDDYLTFLRFASVSTDNQYKGKVNDCAQWLVKKLQGIGLETKLVATAGHPVIWAHNKQQPGRRTVMTYGHYDVQPPDPLELWNSPPFEPVLKNGYVFARGATDNKGQILSHIL